MSLAPRSGRLCSRTPPAAPAACAEAAAVRGPRRGDQSLAVTDRPVGQRRPGATPTISESTVPSAGPIDSPTEPPRPARPRRRRRAARRRAPTSTKPPTRRPQAPRPAPARARRSTSPSPSPSPGQAAALRPGPVPSGSAEVQPGHTAGFVVWVWSADGASSTVSVAAKVATAKDIGAPKFTVCPQASGATCALGTLPAHQADELQAVSAVEPAATSAEQVKLTATATGKGALSGSAAGSLAVTAHRERDQPARRPASSWACPPDRSRPSLASPCRRGRGNLAGLFPTVAPFPARAHPIGFPPARTQPGRTAAPKQPRPSFRSIRGLSAGSWRA